MLIKPYKQEILDDLESKLGNNTVAFTCFLEKSNEPSEVTSKAVAAFGEGRNFDLYYIQSILASIGPNKNDDWFLPEEIWAARQTPVHKQLNFMHDEKNIIGVITDSILLNSDGKHINNDQDISNIVDIATQAVIWTHWDDKKLESKISKIIASIEDNKLFVSMEALFKKFDYMLVKGNQAKIVPRVEQTAFLTKHLRYYGGSGEFDGARVYRILRDFTFSGKGIVDDPANPRSVIDESIFGQSGTNNPVEIKVSLAQSELGKPEEHVKKLISKNMEKIMEDDLKKEVAELKTALAKANEAIASFNKQEVEKVSAEVSNLKEQVKALKALAEDAQAKMEDMEKDCAEKMDKAQKEASAKVEEVEKDAKAKVEEAEAKVAKVEAEKVEAQRISKLVASNVTQEKAAEVVKTFASVSDEMFNEIAALYSQKTVAKTEDVKTTSVEDAVDSAKADCKNTDTKIEKVDENTEDKLTSLSKSIASKLTFIKNKGNK